MPSYVTDQNEVLMIPEDKSCALLWTPPNAEKEEPACFSNAVKSRPKGGNAVELPSEKAVPFLRGHISDLAVRWQTEAPSEDATEDELIKWLDALFDL